VTENTARLIEFDELDEPGAPQGRDSVISSGTRLVGGLMVAAVLVLATFDYLSSIGVLGGASDYVLAALNLVPLAVAALILPVARSLGEGGTIRAQWTLFGLGMLCVGVGNVIFIVLYIATQKDPYPSVADVFTLSGYALFAAGLYLSIRAYKGLLDIRESMLIAAGVAAAALSLVYFTVIGPYVMFSKAGAQPLVTRIFNTVYPVLDTFVLLMPAVALGLLLSKLGAGRVAWPWWLVVAATSTLAVTDTVFAYAGYIHAGRTPLIDSGYAVAPMLLGFAVLVARDIYRS
jgi:hypothetical protein